MRRQLLHLSLGILVLTTLTHTQFPDTGITVILQTPESNATIVQNDQVNSSFIENLRKFDCSMNPLYTYNQSNNDLINNTPYYLTLFNVSPLTVVNISTIHQNFNPTSTPQVCVNSTCNITIQNNCPQSINFFNYFDRMLIKIQHFNQQLSFYVKCNNQFISNTFQWGMVIEIIFITILLYIVAMYSMAWSLQGDGFQFNIWWLIVFIILLIAGAVIGFFSDTGIRIVLEIAVFFLGIIGVAICSNQLIFLLRLQPLKCAIFKIKTFQFRLMEVISLLIGIGLLVGWKYSQNNMIINDIVCLCIVVGLIKILKFTSLKIAALTFLSTIVIELVFAFLLYYTQSQSYNTLFLNQYNYPFELQIPTLNPVYNQKCSWLPVTAIIFPGMLFSYLRRFDSSRSTRLYLVIVTITFAIGGIAWIFASVASAISFPFGLVSEPFMIGLICLFAFRRRELRQVWDGKFYDQQFLNRRDLGFITEMVKVKRSPSGHTDHSQRISNPMLDGLRGQDNNSMDKSVADSTIRSKFLKNLTHQNE